MTTQLLLYNRALRIIGERSLASLAENREPRRALDEVWNEDALKLVLEAGLWTFAIRSMRVTDTPSVEPPFGYRYAFSKPTDWIRTAGMASDEYYRVPLNTMSDEGGMWFSDITPIYVRFVSSDADFGADMALWPPTFMNYVATYLASEVVWRLTKKAELTKEIQEIRLPRALADAQSKDGMNEPTKFLPQGSWSAARAGRSDPRRSMWNGVTQSTPS